ncbi:MAG: hypothetical protein A2905_02950 [Candidatus Levybacteria bacterium RIFCSPLOWO2_01_FULL_36_10]|nr:MAG: hypothetical protein A2905_02950 [Candidatus Levybacteria bacterium RIFCSPLOWO2_01_FULL_36_10]
MNKGIIKKLAQMTVENGQVNETVRNFVLKKLSKKDTKVYLLYLISHIRKNEVYVTIANDPDKNTHENISKLFKSKNIKFKIDPKIGAGLKVEYDDNIVSLNVRNLIERTISDIKDTL